MNFIQDKYAEEGKRIFMVYGIDNPEESLDIKRLFLITDDYERAIHVIKNNVTDIAENGYYPYMLLQPIIFDEMYPEQDSIQIYRWSRKTDIFYHVGHRAMMLCSENSEDEDWIAYDKPEYKNYKGDIADFFE